MYTKSAWAVRGARGIAIGKMFRSREAAERIAASCEFRGHGEVVRVCVMSQVEHDARLAENVRLWAILAQMPCAGEQAAMAGGCGTCPSCEARAKEGK